MTRFLVLDSVISEVSSSPSESGRLWGNRLDDGDLVQMTSTVQGNGLETVGSWVRFKAAAGERSLDGTAVLVVQQGPGEVAIPEVYVDGNPQPTDIIELASTFARIETVLKMDVLRSKNVLVAGLGSGGSRVALELVKAGVGRLTLVDNERLSVENVARHLCGISDLGRHKTKAVRDMLMNHNPFLEIKTFEMDIGADVEAFDGLVRESDLVIAATGSTRLNNITNDLCVKARVPAVFAGVWARGSGGYAMRYIPEITPCYACVHNTIFNLEPASHANVDYSNASSSDELKAEPGLSADIGFISLLQSKFAILALAGDAYESEISQPMVVWLNRAEGARPPWTLLKVNSARRDDCLSCGPGSIRQQAAEAAQARVSEGE